MPKKFFQTLFIAAAFSALINGKGEACNTQDCSTKWSEFLKCCEESKAYKAGACNKFPWGRADRQTYAKWNCECWAK